MSVFLRCGYSKQRPTEPGYYWVMLPGVEKQTVAYFDGEYVRFTRPVTHGYIQSSQWKIDDLRYPIGWSRRLEEPDNRKARSYRFKMQFGWWPWEWTAKEKQ